MKEKIKQITKQVLHYSFLVLLVVIGFGLGILHSKFGSQKPPHNPLTQIYSPNDISIAVNESNSLLIITKNTGEYICYSDSIGQTIFKMYANKIYQQNVGNKTEK